MLIVLIFIFTVLSIRRFKDIALCSVYAANWDQELIYASSEATR